MASDFPAVFSALKTVLSRHVEQLQVLVDKPSEYTLVTQSPSPYRQHKGKPLYFGSIRLGKAYVSFHLMPLYECAGDITSALKKRMQGKTCFNFKSEPGPELIADLEQLTEAALHRWAEGKLL